MKLCYTDLALADLNAVLDYVGMHSPSGALNVRRRIQRVISLLSTHPHIGQRTADPVVRRVNTAPYPYLVFYQVTEAEIIIHAVRHAARDPSGTLDAPRD
ncbi:MAG: type II toxin-antitoxin system RelE/ParE family toxin [Tardiphaga sp.]